MSVSAFLADLGLSRYEESFVANGITEELLPALTNDELKALGVEALGDRKRILTAMSRLVSANLLEPLVERWPSVLAIPLQEYLAEENPVLKIWLACDLVEMLLRFTVMAGVAEARRKGELSEELVRELADRIENPTMGKWRGMAQAVVRGIEPGKAVIPELRPYLYEVLVPLLDGPARPATAETSFSRLRNTLAHGGGLTKSAARRLLGTWQPRIEVAVEKGAWLGEISLRVRVGSDAWGELRGATTSPVPVGIEPALASAHDPEQRGGLYLVRGEKYLELWPLAWHGEPLAEDLSSGGFGESPQVYVRRGEVLLEYTPIGSAGASQSVGEEATLAAFLRLFQPEKRGERAGAQAFAVRGFEADVRKDAGRLVGRSIEVETLRRAVDETAGGVLWISGQAGVGKSFVVAKVATDLLDQAPGETLVLPYRFGAGDDRCGRDPFLQFCLERLGPWLGEKTEAREADDRTRQEEKPQDRLEALLLRLGPSRRVILVLDGLDELAERDTEFASEVPLSLRHRGVVWLCAGRPERGLPEDFEKAKAHLPFPDGLPLMSEADIREMLLEKIGPLRRKLIRGDREAGEGIVNPFIERVARFSEGLPIYVKYVVGDVLAGRISPDEGARLPSSLAKYHEELLRRCTVGDLHSVVTPLVGTLAVAEEPLTREELTALLARRGCVTGDERSIALVDRCLSAVASMVRLARDPEGGDGYTLWHHSLHQHILESPDTALTVATARKAMADGGLTPAGDAAEKYLYRQGITHLLAENRRDEALDLMTDLSYVIGRLDALPESEGSSGLAVDWVTWLLWSADRSEREAMERDFGERLGALCDRSLSEAEALSSYRLAKLLLWEVGPRLERRLGGMPAYREISAVGGRLMARLAALEPENAQYLRDLSVSYDHMGDVERRTDPGKAREWYAEGLMIRQRLATLEPESTQYLRDLSVSYDHMGDIDGRTDSGKAREWYAKGLEICQRLAAVEPENTQYLYGLSFSYDRMGAVDGRTDPGKAREWHAEGLGIRLRLVEVEPENAEYLRDLSVSYEWMGDAEGRTDPEKALEWYAKGVDIGQELLALEPENAQYLRDLLLSYGRMGDLGGRTDTERAREWYTKVLEICQQLMPSEPENTDYLRDLSVAYESMGKLDVRTDPVKAREWYAKGLEVSQRLVALEPENKQYLWDLSVSYGQMGELDGRTDSGKAREWYAKGLEISQRLVALEPKNTQYLHGLSVSYDHMGDIERRTDSGKAREWYAKGLEIVLGLAALEPENVEYLRALSVSYDRMGDVDVRTDPVKARDWYAKGLEIGQALAAVEPENTQYQSDLASSYGRMGNLDVRTDPAKAREWYAEGLEVCQGLAALEPENMDYLRALSISYNQMGDVDGRTDPAKAREWYAKGLEITQRLAALEPENTQYLRDLSISYDQMGDLDVRTDPGKAQEWYAKGLAVRQRLEELTGEREGRVEETETDAATAARKAADEAIAGGALRGGYEKTLDELRIRRERLESQGRRCELDLGMVSVLARAGLLATDLGRLAEAEDHLVLAEKAAGLARKAYPGFDSDRTWEVARNRLGRLALSKGESAKAAETLADVLVRRRSRRFLEPNRNQSIYDIAVTLSFLALARLRLGEVAVAMRLCGEAVFLLKPLVSIDGWRAAARLEMAWALVVQNAASAGTGDHLAKARQILEEIRDHGERDEKLWRVMKEAGMPVPGTEGGTLS